MNRRKILSLIGLTGFFIPNTMFTTKVKPEKLFFKDDNKIPNSKLPLLIYRSAVPDEFDASKLINQFAANQWTNAWDNGIYSYHHYHSTSHEVLGVYAGSATLQLGGESGEKVGVKAGDILIIPAGVGHKKLKASSDFAVVGAYPEGREWDLLKGEPGERPQADKNIAALPIPKTDPLFGKDRGLTTIWS